MSKKKIGIVLATYNGEKYIIEQIRSILQQTVKPDEIIITDAHSSDNTITVIKNLLNNSGINFTILTSDKRISVRENFEKGLKASKADYIFFCDQDDFWIQDKIEITISYMNKYNAVLAFTNAKVVDENLKKYRNDDLWKRIKFKVNNNIEIYNQCDSRFLRELVRRNVVTGMCMCITKELIGNVLPFSKYSIHDSWIAMKAINFGTIIAINKKMVLYRQHNLNVLGANHSNLKQKLKKSSFHLQKIENRYKFIKNWVEKDNINDKFVLQYLDYLIYRINFLQKENKFFSVSKKISDYNRFEVRALSIFVKDVYYRLRF